LYHAFVDRDELPGRFTMPVRNFARQMAWLKRLGYTVITLQQYLQHRRDGHPPPARTVIITFDDGYADVYNLAYPILRRHAFPATVFLVSNRVGGCADWTGRLELGGRRLLDWPQIKEMQLAGFQFGAHTRTHPHLVGMSADCIRREAEGSKLELENSLKVSIDLFAFPFGEYDATVQAIAEQVGFLASCSTKGGLNKFTTAAHALRRTEVDGRCSLLRFFLALRLGQLYLT
jgi:peptidoglycan/xylan/chitin deacetylase (PgdA/CDA1 family)